MTIVIVVMGLVLTIASSSWLGTIEGRRVDSATNQLASDLRLAHSKATNRLLDQVVVLNGGSSAYSAGGQARDLDGEPADKVVAGTSAVITFKADGSATVSPVDAAVFQVASAGDGSRAHTIALNTATSRVQIDPPTP